MSKSFLQQYRELGSISKIFFWILMGPTMLLAAIVGGIVLIVFVAALWPTPPSEHKPVVKASPPKEAEARPQPPAPSPPVSMIDRLRDKWSICDDRWYKAGRPEPSKRFHTNCLMDLGVPPDGITAYYAEVDRMVDQMMHEAESRVQKQMEELKAKQVGPFTVNGRVVDRQDGLVLVFGRAVHPRDPRAYGNLFRETNILAPEDENKNYSSAPGMGYVADLCFSGSKLSGANAFGAGVPIWVFEKCLK